jgi:hypothetical protein
MDFYDTLIYYNCDYIIKQSKVILIRVFFYRKNRTIKAEKSKKTYQLWEEFDGYHSMNDEAILKDRNNTFEPKIVFFENVISPLGSTQTKTGINELVTLINLVKKGGGNIGVSKMASRMLDWILSHLGYVMLFVIIIMALYFGLNPNEVNHGTP